MLVPWRTSAPRPPHARGLLTPATCVRYGHSVALGVDLPLSSSSCCDAAGVVGGQERSVGTGACRSAQWSTSAPRAGSVQVHVSRLSTAACRKSSSTSWRCRACACRCSSAWTPGSAAETAATEASAAPTVELALPVGALPEPQSRESGAGADDTRASCESAKATCACRPSTQQMTCAMARCSSCSWARQSCGVPVAGGDATATSAMGARQAAGRPAPPVRVASCPLETKAT
mmetsp:Transcript_7461/g.19062  ORF Transcript_7461/g.19062 Transcript_7461/m.19062 type:complete len:232 (+) Transcript_7461:774-1469(+)